MSLTIPLRDDLRHFELQTTLDNATYGLELFWNDRSEGWYISLFDAEGDPIVVGKRLVPNFPLFPRTQDARMPLGFFTCYDTTTQDAHPGLTDLGTRHLLVYFTAAEVE